MSKSVFSFSMKISENIQIKAEIFIEEEKSEKSLTDFSDDFLMIKEFRDLIS